MNKVLLMSGASSDIGVAILSATIDQYDHVIAHYYGDKKELQSLYEKHKEKITMVESDFSSEEETNQFVEHVAALPFEVTDIIHLPAGVFRYTKFNKLSWGNFDKDIQISLRSFILILNKFLPNMAKKKYGKVVTMLSHCTCNMPPKYLSSYVTVKYALLGLVKSLAVEYADKNIRINGISPTMMETKFLDNIPLLLKEQSAHNSPTGENLKVSEVVPIIKFLMSDDGSSITGQNIAITNGNTI